MKNAKTFLQQGANEGGWNKNFHPLEQNF